MCDFSINPCINEVIFPNLPTFKMYAAKQIFKENNWSLVGCIQSHGRTSSIHYGIINVPINNIKMVSSRRHCSLAKLGLQTMVGSNSPISTPSSNLQAYMSLILRCLNYFQCIFRVLSPCFVFCMYFCVYVCVCASILDYTAYTINRCIHVCMECRWYFLLFRIANISN